MTKAITRVEPKIEPLERVHTELNQLIHGLNEQAPPAKSPRELSHAERISEDFAKELIGDAQNILTEAQNLLHDDETFAQLVRSEVRKRADRHAHFLERLRKVRTDHEKTRSEFQESNAGDGDD